MHKILIIEDDRPTRTLAAQVLRFQGFEVLEAANGRLGVEAALGSAPDLIVCDIMMPELDGFGVLKTLREDPRTTLTPFIFLTAKITNADRRQGMEEGADDFITKPYDPDELVRSVRRRLEKRGRQIEESRRRAEEVRLAAAASVPPRIWETFDRITTVTNLLAPDESPPNVEASAMDQAVAQESMRMRRMIRRLHLYVQLPQLYGSRFELVGNGPLQPTGPAVERAALNVGRSWNREADLVIAIEPARLPLREEYLVLIIEELVDNACKFSAPGTPVAVTGRGGREFWSLTVGNRGSGMSAEQIARIGAFKQFWSGSKKPEGLGLGLALTQGIARLHGCEFAIESDAEAITATVMVPLET
ncbi:MAG: response regulator [Opitutaceae bacterium]|jgi:CheY-like chemotaxis protein